MPTPERERDVATHRQGHQIHLVGAELVERRGEIVGMQIHRRAVGGDLGTHPVAAQIDGDAGGRLRESGDLRLPHAGVEREPVHEQQRRS